MSFTTFTGPVRSLNGFATPLVYVTAADTSPIAVAAGATVIILSAADGGPAAPVTLTLPEVKTSNGATFNILNADPATCGVRGAVLNYGAVAHVLAGAETAPGVYQKVNGSDTGVTLAVGTLTQWAGNGNPDAPWAASEADLNAAA